MPPRTPPRRAIAVDLAILTVRERQLQVLVVERGKEPFLGALALPGGFLEPGENLDQAAHRELAEETGLDANTLHIEQLASYGDPDRDPRSVVSVCYVALMPDLPLPTAGGDARRARWTAVQPLLDNPAALAFDHHVLLTDAVERARGKLEYTTLATAFCPPTFTVADLRQVYETVWNTRLDPANFHRKVTRAEGFLLPTTKTAASQGGRPGKLYHAGKATQLYPPLLRD
ncbi:NUDIX domain-containing protein [Amycolatopsis sp. YIM 10]|uniref:NUDIX domain-containing protein n=1 Tax=Amycolatopsis sp. YIM 10 TaxID=2653857 RepID=UPI0012907122|nr:NUDIX domain-containing protein [Amycolatopsis sp. YIM 10]